MTTSTYLFGSISDNQITITRLTQGRLKDHTYTNPTPSSRRRILTYAARKNFRIEGGSLIFSDHAV